MCGTMPSHSEFGPGVPSSAASAYKGGLKGLISSADRYTEKLESTTHFLEQPNR